MAAFAGRAARRLPEGLNYGAIRTLSKESREKLAKARTTHPRCIVLLFLLVVGIGPIFYMVTRRVLQEAWACFKCIASFVHEDEVCVGSLESIRKWRRYQCLLCCSRFGAGLCEGCNTLSCLPLPC